MRMLRRVTGTAAMAALLTIGCGEAADKPYAASAATCTPPTPAVLQWLDPSQWRQFERDVRVCRVAQGRAPAALLIVSVWADLYYKDKPGGTQTVAMPKPLLFTPAGKLVGELPSNFPSDPPAELIVRFTDWRQDFPNEIRLCVSSPTAAGDQALTPLRYDARTRQFNAATGAAAKTSKGDCRVR